MARSPLAPTRTLPPPRSRAAVPGRAPVWRRAVSALLAVLALAGTLGVLTPATEAHADPLRKVVMVVTTDPDVAPIDRQTALDTARRQFTGMSDYWEDISNGTVDFELENDDIVWLPDRGYCSSTGAERNAAFADLRAATNYQSGPQRHFIINVANCTSFGGWGGGNGLTGGGSFYVEDPKWAGVWTHEMGHTIGFGHANLVACSDGTVDGYAANETTNPNAACEIMNYGDAFDTMASSTERTYRGFSAPWAIRDDFYTADEYIQATGRAFEQTVTIQSRDTEDAPVAVKIVDPRNGLEYYVEYVMDTEYDRGMATRSTYNGVLYRKDYGVRVMRFHQVDPKTTVVIPGPVDAAGERHANWLPGQVFNSVSGGVEVEVVSVVGTTATLRVRLTGLPVPEAQADTATTDVDQSVSIDPLANDEPAPRSTLDPTSVVFPTDGQPTGADVATDGRTLTVTGEGVYTVSATTGEITFAPEAGYTGRTDAITYRVADVNGATDTATLSVTVLQAAPTVVLDESTTAFETPSGPIDVLANDVAPTGGTIDVTSVVFPTADQPTGAVVAADGRSLTVPGQGSYVVDPATGEVSFTPVDGFSGRTTPVTYQVSSVGGRSASTTLAVTVAADPRPVAADETAVTPYETEVEIDVVADASASAGRTIVADSVTFPDSTTADQKSITIAGQGTFAVDADGIVTFTPADGFTGPVDAVTYQLADSTGDTARAQIRITVGEAPPSPTTADDAGTTAFRTPAVIDVLANDTLPDGAPGSIDRTSVRFDANGGRELVVDGEGTWTIAEDTGVVTFTPEPLFVGDASPVTYRVANAIGDAGPATAQIEVTVEEPAAPAAGDDVAQTPGGRVVDIPVLDNDDSAVDWVLGTLRFTADGQPSGATVSPDGTSITVPGEGTYTVDRSSGAIDFRSATGFVGTTTPVTYRVDDELGRTASGTVSVQVDPAPPVAEPDRVSTEQGEPVGLDPLANDTPSTGATFDRRTLTLLADDGSGGGVSTVALSPVRTLTVDGEGTWRVTDDDRIVFTPVADFVGTTTPVSYQATDSVGGVAQSTITAVVAAAPEVTPSPTPPPSPSPTDPSTQPDPTSPPGTGGHGGGPGAGPGGSGVGGDDLAETGGTGFGVLVLGVGFVLTGAGALWRSRPRGTRGR